MPDLERHGDIFVLQMDSGENRFVPEMIAGWNAALDEVEKAAAPKALVTIGTGKFYSNGLDLDYMMNSGDMSGYVSSVLAIMKRVLVFPAYTVAALNGHAFGAGAQVALAHDARVMRTGRGFFCMPEIDMKAYLHPGMTAIIQARLPHQSAHELIVTGMRYSAERALERKIVDRAVSEEELLPTAIAMAAEWAAKAHPVMSVLKRDMYPRALAALDQKLEPPS
ncbi:MAG: enoyl-CoA hydratase/isomerase family protein [Deltaproteobacteria bacterium]|nr:MAG: enoyl-CoA hydratase/isomerase family protein [Deltaproteobacteria bacterium]